MGVYLNSKSAHTLYKSESQRPFFVDKSRLLEELFPLVRAGNSHVCITRPRRFGKTVMANMIAAFFSKACDAQDIFQTMEIAESKDYEKYRNQYPVIHIAFNDLPKNQLSYERYIERIERRLIRDLKREYPQAEWEEDEGLADVLLDIYAEDDSARFIFVLDEWDFIFHQDFVTEEDKKAYLMFLRSVLKDRPYVRLAYMTGILPIAKYASGSELNMFAEFTMEGESRFSEYFGFTEEEVDALFARYQKMHTGEARVTREGLRRWYDGYCIMSGGRLYNPRSVIMSLTNNNLRNYWTSSGPYDEIFYYIKKNVAAVREDLARMMAGASVPVKLREYAATAQNLMTREEIFSAMVIYGFLSCQGGEVSIPNKELADQFADMIQKESSLGYVHRLAKESQRMLQATLAQDTRTMEEILEYAHNTETPLFAYNHETELAAIVNLVYLAARDTYRVEREDRAGKGYVDFIFYPETNDNADGIILELKVDRTPQEAIRQIQDREYALAFRGKMAERKFYAGRVLGVGISYDRVKKKHHCQVVIL